MDIYKQYDLIFSIGGNCAAAHNLRLRGLRKFSLPFDWTYIKDESALYKLADEFENNFKNSLILKNLQELSKEEYSQAHSDKFQYKDLATGYYWVNHFSQKIDNNIKEYTRVKRKFDKRVTRLDNYIKKSKTILLILSTDLSVNIEPCRYLINKLNEKYPNKIFDIKVLSFGCQENITIEEPNIIINHYKRELNLNDFIKTNIEWEFLDTIDYNPILLNSFFNLMIIEPQKRGLAIHVLPSIKTIFYIKIYFIVFRLQFVLGRNKNE